jgi:hypothetical protein
MRKIYPVEITFGREIANVARWFRAVVGAAEHGTVIAVALVCREHPGFLFTSPSGSACRAIRGGTAA